MPSKPALKFSKGEQDVPSGVRDWTLMNVPDCLSYPPAIPANEQRPLFFATSTREDVERLLKPFLLIGDLMDHKLDRNKAGDMEVVFRLLKERYVAMVQYGDRAGARHFLQKILGALPEIFKHQKEGPILTPAEIKQAEELRIFIIQQLRSLG